VADDVDPNESPSGEAPTAVDTVDALGAGGQPATGGHGPVDIAMVEIELVEFDPAEHDDAEVERIEAVEPTQPAEPLPTMADLDRVASELDDVDARLAALEEQRP